MRRIIFPLLFGIIGAAILISLGVWQIQRLAWKSDVLAQIDARISGDAIALPATPDFDTHRYAPVSLNGTLLDDELYVLTSRKHVGAGYLVISPFVTEDGRRILMDRGFIMTDERSAERPVGDGRFEGNINWPDDRTSSTPENDISGNIWFARDVAEMAAVLDTEPLMVIASRSSPDFGTIPLPVDTSAIPNDHLEYALTWFSLAAICIVMMAALIIRILRKEA